MPSESSPDRIAIQNAREALRRADQTSARSWAEEAAKLAPNSADPLLILAAISDPRASLDYAKRALVLEPDNARARKAVDWARSRFGADVPAPAVGRVGNPTSKTSRSATPTYAKKPGRRNFLTIGLIVVGLACIAVIAIFSARPVLAALFAQESAPAQAVQQDQFAQVQLAKPTYTPAPTFTPSATSTAIPTFTPPATFTPEITNTPLPTETPQATNTAAPLEMSILVDTPTSIAPPTKEYVPPVANAAPVGNGVRWIDVDLTNQRVYAYEGDVIVNNFLVSTGTWQTPTVTGKFKIWIKVRSQTMSGPGYSLPGVPYVMYFYKGYGFHGTYWHNNFGTPMSHGCVNLTISDAEWLYYWASVGTVVNVHY